MIKKLFTGCFFLLISLNAQAAAPLAEIQTIVTKPDILCGRFDQTKQLVGIKKPLTSYGRFCVVTNKGILWRTLQPFPNTVRLTRDEIVQTRDNQVAMRLDAKQEPTVQIINNVLFSLLAGDLSQLNKLFEIDGNIKNKNWQVTLKARAPALANAIGTITLAGSQHVKQVFINEASGDRTHIIFSAIKSGNTAMTTEEGTLFEQ